MWTTFRSNDLPARERFDFWQEMINESILPKTLSCERAEDALEPHTRRQALRMRIDAYVQQHLADPDLSPTTIAAAHHISTSYLHKLFRNQAVTITRLIRQYRLERCLRTLADPRYASHPLHRIASSWGFTDKAHFSRIFRTAYGMPPSDYRALVLSRPPDHPQRLQTPPTRVSTWDRIVDCCF